MNFLETQRPIFNLLSFLGFFYYDFKLEANFRMILFNVLATLLWQSTFSFISFTNMEELTKKSYDDSYVIAAVNYATPTISILFFISINITMIYKRTDQLQFFRKIFLLENQLKCLRITAELNKFQKNALKQSWISFFIIQIFCVMDFISTYFDDSSWWFILESLIILVYFVYLICIIEFLVAILKCLLNSHSISMKIMKNRQIQKGNEKFIKSFKRNLLYLIDDFSATFGFIYMQIFLCITLTSSLQIYFCLCSIQHLHEISWKTINYCLNNICWQLFFYFHFIKFLYFFEKLESEVRSS